MGHLRHRLNQTTNQGLVINCVLLDLAADMTCEIVNCVIVNNRSKLCNRFVE